MQLRRPEPEESAAGLGYAAPATPSEAVRSIAPEDGLDTAMLPEDHPRWARDAVALSKAARALLERLRPVAVRVMTMWDHRFRAIFVGDRRVTVDVSGSYRLST